jgi:hypothetical protein
MGFTESAVDPIALLCYRICEVDNTCEPKQ